MGTCNLFSWGGCWDSQLTYFWPYLLPYNYPFAVISWKLLFYNDILTPTYEVTFRMSMFNCLFHIREYLYTYPWKRWLNCQIIVLSLQELYCIVAVTPKTATTQLLQHQKQQLRSCCNTRSSNSVVATVSNSNYLKQAIL